MSEQDNEKPMQDPTMHFHERLFGKNPSDKYLSQKPLEIVELGESKLGGMISYIPAYGVYTIYHQSDDGKINSTVLKMQSGNPQSEGVNGFTIEDLICVAEHRLNQYNETLPDPNNDAALVALSQAKLHLARRQRNRTKAGVAGTGDPIPQRQRINPVIPEVPLPKFKPRHEKKD